MAAAAAAVQEIAPRSVEVEGPPGAFDADDVCACPSTDTSVSRNTSGTKPESEAMASPTLLFLLSIVSLIEGVDDAMLPAVAYAIQLDLSLDLSQVTSMSMIQALTMAVFAPLWGILADRQVMTRKLLMATGCIGQGIVTIILAFTSDYGMMMSLRALNGIMLASLKPIAVSVLSGVSSETNRGKSFAWIQFASLLGMMTGFLVGTPLSRMLVLGMHGWRVAFIGIGGISVVVGALVYGLMTEPYSERPAGKGPSTILGTVKEEVRNLAHYFTLPSFLALVFQGCIGLVPWKVLNYQTLYFQVAGLTDLGAGVLQASNQFVSAFGNLLGGKIGDSLARRCPNHGRAFAAQISVFSGIPLAALLFLVPPPSEGAFFWYLFLVVAMGLLATWCAVGVNWPILTQIVAPENRGTVMAWEAALEGSFASVVGNLAVSFFAQTLFGFDLEVQTRGADLSMDNMFALGFALTMTSAVPWIICLIFYTLLHWSLPRDLRRMRQATVAGDKATPRITCPATQETI